MVVWLCSIYTATVSKICLMILMANVANLDRFVTLKFDSKHCLSFLCVFYHYIYYI